MCAVPNMAAFCCSLTSCIPRTLFRYFLDNFEFVLVDPVITGITLLLHSTHAVFLLSGPYILEPSQLPSWSHFCLLELQHCNIAFSLFKIADLLLLLLLLKYWYFTTVVISFVFCLFNFFFVYFYSFCAAVVFSVLPLQLVLVLLSAPH